MAHPRYGVTWDDVAVAGKQPEEPARASLVGRRLLEAKMIRTMLTLALIALPMAALADREPTPEERVHVEAALRAEGFHAPG
jgi:hypothetical protein